MVIIRRGLFAQASPTRPHLSTFEELLVEEELAKEGALKEAIEAAHGKVIEAEADVKTSCSVKATSVTTQTRKRKRNHGTQQKPKQCPA